MQRVKKNSNVLFKVSQRLNYVFLFENGVFFVENVLNQQQGLLYSTIDSIIHFLFKIHGHQLTWTREQKELAKKTYLKQLPKL